MSGTAREYQTRLTGWEKHDGEIPEEYRANSKTGRHDAVEKNMRLHSLRIPFSALPPYARISYLMDQLVRQ